MKRIPHKICVCMLALLMLLALPGLSGCGKKDSFDSQKAISVVAREDGSGTKSAFMEIIGLKGKADVSGVIIATGTAAMLAEVRSNPLAIGYESLGYVTSDVKVLKVDGVSATVENIKNGSYKIARPLNVVYQPKNGEKALNAAFLAFLQSDTAQSIIKENGYVSLIDGAGRYTVDASLAGTLDISGSTSLQPLMIKLAAEFERIQKNVTVTVSGGGSGTGYKNAAEGVSDFGMISETFKEEKAPGCTYYEVAKDGIALIVNTANPQKSISLTALKNIYNSEAGAEAVKTWADAGK